MRSNACPPAHHRRLLLLPSDLEQTTTSATYQDTKAIAQVRERVAPQTKAGKAAALRTQCEAQLGRLFPEVYAYLRNMRTQGTAGARGGSALRVDHPWLRRCLVLREGNRER